MRSPEEVPEGVQRRLSPLTRALAIVQIVGALAFLVALLGALLYQEKLRESFRMTINETLAKRLAGRVSLAEELVATPLATKYLAPHQLEGIREELLLYRKDPLAYVTYLTGGKALDQRRQIDESSLNPVKRAFLEKVMGWRSSIKARFDLSFAKVGRDVCIFLGTNAAALMFACFLAIRGHRYLERALAVSVILTLSVLLSSLAYVDRDWIYVFLRNDWAVIAYPGSLLLLFVYLMLNFYRRHGRS